MRRLIMLSRDRFPSERAHSINQIRMCDGFADTGVDVRLLYPDHAFNLPGDIREFYGLRNRITTIKVPCIARDIRLPEWLHGSRLDHWKSRFVTDIVGITTTASILVYFLKLIRNGDLGDDDIIYGRSAYFALFLTKILLKIMGRPNKVALEIHHPPYGRAGLIAFFIKRLDHVFVINSFLLNVFFEMGFKRVTVVPDGVDVIPFDTLRRSTTKIELRIRHNLPVDQKIIVYAGHLYPYKGVDDLISAAASFPDATLLIVGGYPEDVARCRALANDLGLKNVIFTGFVNPSVVPEYLVASDLCVYTLRPDAPIRDFTSPIKLFEYLASGNPSIAAGVPGVGDVIIHGEAGLLYEIGNVNSLIIAINELISNSNLSEKISRNGLLIAESNSWSRRANKILNVL